MTIIQHNFNGVSIHQVSNDSELAGHHVPRGYVNLTEMCKVSGSKKKLADYLRLSSTKEYLEALKVDMGNPVTGLIVIVQGSYAGDSTLQGTWGHFEVAVDLAKWISPSFRIWANRVLSLVIHGDYKALTPEAQLAAERLNKLWDEIRKHGKETRRKLTDAIASYLERHLELSDDYANNVYGGATNAMYKAVFGMTAVELEEFLECKRNHSRDYLDRKCLSAIDRAEEGICNLIDNRDIEPYLAVKNYQDFFSIKKMFPSKKLEAFDLN